VTSLILARHKGTDGLDSEFESHHTVPKFSLAYSVKKIETYSIVSLLCTCSKSELNFEEGQMANSVRILRRDKIIFSIQRLISIFEVSSTENPFQDSDTECIL
jgi:hypothetical protein